MQVEVGSAPPGSTGSHTPGFVVPAQVMQVPEQVVLQHTPCSQIVEAHSDPVPQGVPGGFSEQLPLLHFVGDTQSASAVQVVLHTRPPESQSRLPGQLPGVTVLQVPPPSQVAAGVKTWPVQAAGAHWVPLGQSRQCPAPSQKPSVMQPLLAVIVHWLVGVGATPAPTGEQVPVVPDRAQDMQISVQAVSQQTPWAQKPETQDAAAVQAAPGGSLPQLPLLQTFGDTQSLSPAHVALQAVLAQVNGSHLAVVAGRQVPAPSQVRACVSVEPVQDGDPQAVPAG